MKMKCPVCLRNQSIPTHLSGSLNAFACQVCQGNWIRRKSYERWLKQRPSAESAARSRPLERVPTGNGRGPKRHPPMPRFCPDCRTFLTKYAVGKGFDFEIDACGSCGGFWLDGGEWQAMAEHQLHEELHFIASSTWQRSVREERRRSNHSRRLEESLGSDFERVMKLRDWLDAHPKAELIRRVLVAEESLMDAAANAPAKLPMGGSSRFQVANGWQPNVEAS